MGACAAERIIEYAVVHEAVGKEGVGEGGGRRDDKEWMLKV